MSREKKEKTRVIQPHTVRRLLKYLMHYRWMFALALVLAVASNVFRRSYKNRFHVHAFVI